MPAYAEGVYYQEGPSAHQRTLVRKAVLCVECGEVIGRCSSHDPEQLPRRCRRHAADHRRATGHTEFKYLDAASGS